MQLLHRIKHLFGGGKVDIRERFELLREAVHGTMSNFYMARDRSTGEIVGLKILDSEKTKKFEARFAGLNKPSEGQIAMSLVHPRIVKTLEHGTTTKGEPYLVMEYLEGQGLNTLIQARSQQLAGRRLPLLHQAAEAAAAVHEAGYIHRDICPRNFVVDPELTWLKLIDFGLTVPDQPPYKQPGNRTGTPKYMAPEIVRRRITDRRLDVFSFGVTAYELFAFEFPWPTVATSGKAAMEHDKPPVPIQQVVPDINPHLAELIHACLMPKPEDRPESMDAFLERLARIEQESA